MDHPPPNYVNYSSAPDNFSRPPPGPHQVRSILVPLDLSKPPPNMSVQFQINRAPAFSYPPPRPTFLSIVPRSVHIAQSETSRVDVFNNASDFTLEDNPRENLKSYPEETQSPTRVTSQYPSNKGSFHNDSYSNTHEVFRNSKYDDKYYRSGSSSSSRNANRSHYSSGSSRRRSESAESRNSKYDHRLNEKQFSPSNSRRSRHEEKQASEREILLQNWRKNYCATSEEITKKLKEMSAKYTEAEGKPLWSRSSPSDLFYKRLSGKVVEATPRLDTLCEKFNYDLVERGRRAKEAQNPIDSPQRKIRLRVCKHKSEHCDSINEAYCSDDSMDTDEEDCSMEELSRKLKHPYRLHREMWYNDPGEMNDGPLCRCSARARRSGIRHGVYPGEADLAACQSNTNNADRLHHYRITISPPTNFLTKTPTIIKHDEHEFLFEGFSMFSHSPLGSLPTCKVIRFNIEYTILYVEETMPEHFTIEELDLFFEYLFHELLELVDFDLRPSGDSSGCSIFHFMPRFVRDLPDSGKEILSMNEVLRYLLANSDKVINQDTLKTMHRLSQYDWQDFADEVKGMVVTKPGQKPCSVRVDQLDRNIGPVEHDQKPMPDHGYPEIIHFGIRPPQLSYAGNPDYQKAWRDYVKYRHLIANMPKPSFDDKRKLENKEARLQEMRNQGRLKRDVTVALSSEGFYRTGIMCDIVQHAMLIPVLACHLRFHRSLDVLERNIKYRFKNRFLLQLALTHPSYRENFGTNPDHARNSLTNCGIRQPEYGDRRIHYMNNRKRGINTLINIMSRFGKQKETESNITHNERLEFLGDAVVEFLTSIHLFFMFPDLEEGGLATYRAAIVQNQHLAQLAKKIHLEEYMLYAHGSDLCHALELRHAMANCFEALMGALFLDGQIEVADCVFASALFMENADLLNVWTNLRSHPLQQQEPNGDRKWIEKYELLQKLSNFEQSIGVEFNHIRLLARAFTDRSIGFTNLTLGSNQRLEFLGDTVLQLISSEYLYRHFPEHHEGHLSLLRSSLVNNRTQAVVCNDLGMTAYAVYSNPKAELKTKDRADLLEALLGALYVDKGIRHCQVFCQVCLFPRLQDFIMNQDWNDPKSKLQQCCLTLRTMDGGEPDIPVYKVIECIGPTNTRVYTVAVYFRGCRLATATGHSIQQAEMHSAKKALENSQELFPQLDHQKRVIAKSMKIQKGRNENKNTETVISSKSPSRHDVENEDFDKATKKGRVQNQQDIESLPKQYITEEYNDSESSEDGFDSSTILYYKKNKQVLDFNPLATFKDIAVSSFPDIK